jgi:hypothetical protein
MKEDQSQDRIKESEELEPLMLNQPIYLKQVISEPMAIK